MATVTLISKQSISGSSSVTFSGISSAYKDLRCIATVKSSATGNFNGTLALRFNSDSSSIYTRTAMGNENANLLTQHQNSGLNGLLVATAFASAANNADNRCVADIYVPKYANSNRYKSINAFSWSGGYNDSGGGVYNYQWLLTGSWQSTNAVTSLTLYEVAGANLTGTVSLYGIE